MRAIYLLVCMGSWVVAEEWPEFRGPTGQGVTEVETLPLTWGPGERVRWRVAIPGGGWSSPVVVGKRIFLTAAVPVEAGGESTDYSLRAMALEGESGAVVWDEEVFVQRSAESPKIHKKNSHASPTPIVDDGRVYVHFGHMGTACLEADDGKRVWRSQENPYAPVHGNGGSPVLWKDLLIFNADAAEGPAVIALNRKTGETVWKKGRESGAKRKFSFSTPVLIEVEGKVQLVTAGSGVVQALDPRTGEEIWRVNYGEGYSVVPRPVYADGRLYVCTGYDKPRLLAIRVAGAVGDATGSHVVWEATKYVPHNPSLLVLGGEVYSVADNGIFSCHDAVTGEPRYAERCTGPISASLLAAPGRIYATDEQGLTVVVEPGTTYRELGRSEMEERTLASLAVIGGDLLMRTEGALYRIGQ